METDMTDEWIGQKNGEYATLSPREILIDACSAIQGRLVFASSMGIEDQVLTHIIATEHLPIEIFTLDTGRLFPETYELIDRTESRYEHLKIKVMFPDAARVEAMVNEIGINGFYNSKENRVRCCEVRKLEPLSRALQGASGWITGLRREQSPLRDQVSFVENDDANGILKLNPLLSWTADEVRNFVTQNRIPYNPMHDRGFPSIGCLPCTRAVLPGEDFRAGRWWWESSHKECGLHYREKVDTK